MRKVIKLDCPFCSPDLTETLVTLPITDKEYYLVTLLDDGTKKAYICEGCDGVFFYDKMSDTWQVSPATYDKFVKEGKLRDQLTDD